MINNDVYQYILDEVITFVDIDWEKVVIYLEYGETSYTFSFYVKNADKYIKCFDLEGISEAELMESFGRIDKFVSSERNTLKDKWTNMTMVVTATGEMKVDFDYTDLSEGTYQFKKNWKKNYLI